MPAPSPNLDAIFAALSDPTRRAILAHLVAGRASVTDLAEPFAVSLPAISKHVRVLEAAGLVRREREGRIHWCRLAAHPMRDAAQWLAAYRRLWERSLEASRPASRPGSRARPRRRTRENARGRIPRR